MGSSSSSSKMGNAAARQRLTAHDFKYIAKNTAFLTESLVEEYYAELLAGNTDGKITKDQFKKIFNLAFPERPAHKLSALTKKLANEEKTDGKIPLASIALLVYLFCDGKTEENLSQMFNMFDEDGNGSISIEELLSLMALFIELGMDEGTADMATVMAEVYNLGDRDKNDKLERSEFINGMMKHPVTKKLLQIKTIDALLNTY